MGCETEDGGTTANGNNKQPKANQNNSGTQNPMNNNDDALLQMARDTATPDVVSSLTELQEVVASGGHIAPKDVPAVVPETPLTPKQRVERAMVVLDSRSSSPEALIKALETIRDELPTIEDQDFVNDQYQALKTLVTDENFPMDGRPLSEFTEEQAEKFQDTFSSLIEKLDMPSDGIPEDEMIDEVPRTEDQLFVEEEETQPSDDLFMAGDNEPSSGHVI